MFQTRCDSDEMTIPLVKGERNNITYFSTPSLTQQIKQHQDEKKEKDNDQDSSPRALKCFYTGGFLFAVCLSLILLPWLSGETDRKRERR